MYVSYHKVEYSGVLIHDFQFTQGILKNPIIPIYQVGILTNFFLCLVINIQIYVVFARPILFFTMLLRAFYGKGGY